MDSFIRISLLYFFSLSFFLLFLSTLEIFPAKQEQYWPFCVRYQFVGRETNKTSSLSKEGNFVRFILSLQGLVRKEKVYNNNIIYMMEKQPCLT
jgi:hypothetical protein